MSRIALVGIGIYMIGDGWRGGPNNPGSIAMIVGGVLFLVAALGVDF